MPFKCHYCGEMGHIQRNCPSFRVQCFAIYEDLSWDMIDLEDDDPGGFWHGAVEEVAKGRCYNCGKEGHFQNKCTEPKRVRPINALRQEVEMLRRQLQQVLDLKANQESGRPGQSSNP